jgi:succinate-acetate transporter protein
MKEPEKSATQGRSANEKKAETALDKGPEKVIVPQAPAAWANPTAAGLVALAVACFCFFALLTKQIDASAMPLIGCWLLGGFAVQIVVAIIDLKGGNTTGGNTFLFFSAFFMLVGGLEMFLKYNGIVAGVPLDSRIDGYAWVVLTLSLWLWTPAFCKPFSLLSLVVIAIDVAVPFIALMDLKLISGDFAIIPAVALLCAGIIAIYLCSAMVVNTAFGRKIYPVIEKRK